MLRALLGALRRALDRDETFAISWDLRKLVPPSLSALNYGQRWMDENAADIERLGESNETRVANRVAVELENLEGSQEPQFDAEAFDEACVKTTAWRPRKKPSPHS